MTTTRIDKFEVRYASNNHPPQIYLKSRGRCFGNLIFCQNGTGLPPDSIVNDLKVLYYHVDDFENVYELLRTGKHLLLDFGPGHENGIVTSTDVAIPD